MQVHHCLGSAQAYYGMTGGFQRFAEKKGILLIYPDTSMDSHCWDVSSAQTLKHDGGGDSESISRMVLYALKKYNADSSKVFATGLSSGAMMTNVLMATYPDLFAGGAAFSGVPYGCLAKDERTGRPQEKGHSSPFSDYSGCPQGKLPAKSASSWGAQVREAYPGYVGPRPKMMAWHETMDPIVKYVNLAEEMKQWSDILGVSFKGNVSNDPSSGYTKMVYGDGTKLVGYSIVGANHFIPEQPVVVTKFWGL